MNKGLLKVGLAQIAPIWLDRKRTTIKIVDYIKKAAAEKCQLVTFGEAILPGYPFWIERTEGSKFNSSVQKEMYALYLDQAVQIEKGDLDLISKTAQKNRIAVVVGIMERAVNRGGHSVYASLVYINEQGEIKSVHRKLMPTYEERLCWALGDGHGLQVHELGAFMVGGLNCWENWMPLSRTALYAQGEDLHVAIWPGGYHNTHDLTKFMAKEGRSFVISVSGIMRKSDINDDVPNARIIRENSNDFLANGGSCISGPDGEWIIEPQLEKEGLFTAIIDHKKIREERHNYDLAGHYSRPDVTKLVVDRKRQSIIDFED
jgi:nitrilase